jgi:hypothetical protein
MENKNSQFEKIDVRKIKEMCKELEPRVKFLKLRYEEMAYLAQIYELEKKYGHILYGGNNEEINQTIESQNQNYVKMEQFQTSSENTQESNPQS